MKLAPHVRDAKLIYKSRGRAADDVVGKTSPVPHARFIVKLKTKNGHSPGPRFHGVVREI